MEWRGCLPSQMRQPEGPQFFLGLGLVLRCLPGASVQLVACYLQAASVWRPRTRRATRRGALVKVRGAAAWVRTCRHGSV